VSTRRNDFCKLTNGKQDSFEPRNLLWIFCAYVYIDSFRIACLDSVQQLEHLPNTRTQIDAATRMAENLKEAVLYQSHAASIRAKRSYLEVLTPRQTILYQEWLSNKNRERLSEVMKRRRARSSSFEADNNPCLMDVCRKLEEILRISKQGE
jgi:hypothetical protein